MVAFKPASDESQISGYKLYWSNADGSTLTATGSLNKSTASYDIASSVTLDKSAAKIVITSMLNGLESTENTAVSVVDLYYPTSLSSSSVSADGLNVSTNSLSGNLSLSGLASSDATEFVIYWGASDSEKMSGSTSIAKITKTDGSASYTFASAVSVPAGATYILIYPANGGVEATQPVSIQISAINKAPKLSSFTAVASTSGSQGDITLTLTYPSQTSRYKTLEVRRIAGSTAPNSDCSSNGTVISTVTNFSSQTFRAD